MRTLLLYVIAVSAFLLLSCVNSDDPSECNRSVNLEVDQDQLAADIEGIDEYLEEMSIQADIDPSGLRYLIIEEGSGDAITLCDNVRVSYTGSLISDGRVFDSATSPVSFPLSNLIRGWQIGLPLINEGGEIELFIPSVYAYGEQGIPRVIPSNANLRFRITVQ